MAISDCKRVADTCWVKKLKPIISTAASMPVPTDRPRMDFMYALGFLP
ncbi:MAG: hypothetical protein ACOX50_03420 [Patescibacteria group bacterium]|jgi:hypothetical protein